MLCLVVFSSCGYKIAGLDGTAKYYIERVENKTQDTTYEQIAQNVLNRYFVVYGEYTSYEKATHTLTMAIDKVELVDNILTATDEASSTDLTVNAVITVFDRNGVIVFSQNFASTENFNVSSNVATSLINRDAAFSTAIENILQSYRNAFNTRF